MLLDTSIHPWLLQFELVYIPYEIPIEGQKKLKSYKIETSNLALPVFSFKYTFPVSI